MSLRDSLKDTEKELKNFLLNCISVQRDNIPELTRFFKNLREVKDFIDDTKKLVDSTYEQLSKQTIPDIFERIKMDNASLHGRQFIVSSRMWASIPADKQGEGFSWLRKNNWDMLIEEKVNAQKLSSAMTGLFRETNTLPPKETMTIVVEKHTSIRKS